MTIVNKGCFAIFMLLSPAEHVLKGAPTRSISLQDVFACRDRAVPLAAQDARC
jgi:hypothetical protein